MEIVDSIYGCTDDALNYNSEAANYNSDAIEDDGSCEYPIDCSGLVALTINMSDSYGDGWNGNVLTLNGQEFTLDGSCYDPESDV